MVTGQVVFRISLYIRPKTECRFAIRPETGYLEKKKNIRPDTRYMDIRYNAEFIIRPDAGFKNGGISSPPLLKTRLTAPINT